MTFTINVPVFPMRKEVAALKARKRASCFPFSLPGLAKADGKRTRDADGFLEMEMLPLDELEGVRRPTQKYRKQSM